MEKTEKGIVIPLNVGGLILVAKQSENSRKDQQNNFIKGNVITKNSKNVTK